jgi:glutathione S-transferase
VLTESAAIVEYLAETFGDSAKLYLPHGVEARAALNESCYFIMTELDSGSLYVVRRHEELASIYGEAPAAVHSAKVYFLHNLEAIMPRIPEAGYLFSDLLSTADIC